MSEIVLSAAELRQRIYNELEGTTVACFALEQSWVRLGVLLHSFKANEGWRELGYATFDAFISELKHKFNRGRTVLYGYIGAVEHVLPVMTAEQMEQAGISKVLELKRALKRLGDGKTLPPALLEAALDPTKTTSELRGDIGKALNMTEDPKGTWFDLQGFFMLPDERKEFKEAWLASEALLGLKSEIPDHIRRKSVIMAWMQEFWGTHAPEFYGDANAVSMRLRPTNPNGVPNSERLGEGRAATIYTGSQSGPSQGTAVLIVRASSATLQSVSEQVATEGESSTTGVGATATEATSELQE